MYLRLIGPDSAREPARAKPKPSRIDFFPSATTPDGMSSYFVFRTNCATYFVRPVVSGKGFCPATAISPPDLLNRVAAPVTKDAFNRSRLIMVSSSSALEQWQAGHHKFEQKSADEPNFKSKQSLNPTSTSLQNRGETQTFAIKDYSQSEKRILTRSSLNRGFERSESNSGSTLRKTSPFERSA